MTSIFKVGLDGGKPAALKNIRGSLIKRRMPAWQASKFFKAEKHLAPNDISSDLAILDKINRWLYINRAERMDALDSSGVFPPDRQAFHRARYEFATEYVRDLLVADIACGLGYGCRILKEGGAKRVIGIDASSEAIAYAQFRHEVEGVTHQSGDATNVLLTDGLLDAITSFETIEHVPDTAGLLSEFWRILKPEGKLIVSSPNDWGLTQHHCHTWTPLEFMAEVNAFFSIESVWEQNSASKRNNNQRTGMRPWSKETERFAECMLIVAKKCS